MEIIAVLVGVSLLVPWIHFIAGPLEMRRIEEGRDEYGMKRI